MIYLLGNDNVCAKGICFIQLSFTVEKIWQTIENVSKIITLELHIPHLQMIKKHTRSTVIECVVLLGHSPVDGETCLE